MNHTHCYWCEHLLDDEWVFVNAKATCSECATEMGWDSYEWEVDWPEEDTYEEPLMEVYG